MLALGVFFPVHRTFRRTDRCAKVTWILLIMTLMTLGTVTVATFISVRYLNRRMEVLSGFVPSLILLVTVFGHFSLSQNDVPIKNVF